MTAQLGLSHAESVFVDNLIALGDENAAAVASGVQPSLALDPRIQSAIVERIRQHGPADAAYARKVLRELAERAENESVRFKAATALWERGLGKVPDRIEVDMSIQHLPRATIWAEIRALIAELGVPEDDADLAELTQEAPTLIEAAPEPEPAHAPEPPAPPVEEPRAAPYIPELPTKWR